MKELKVSRSNRPALIDDEDFEWASKWTWGLHNRGYVVRFEYFGKRPDGRKIYKALYLHRAVLKAPKGRQVDHKDRDKLNNQKANLRLCNNSQNHLNAPKRVRLKGEIPTSKYKGVVRVKDYKRTGLPRFFVHSPDGSYVGYFSSEIEAAKAYDRAAYVISPEFALLNFP